MPVTRSVSFSSNCGLYLELNILITGMRTRGDTTDKFCVQHVGLKNLGVFAKVPLETGEWVLQFHSKIRSGCCQRADNVYLLEIEPGVFLDGNDVGKEYGWSITVV